MPAKKETTPTTLHEQIIKALVARWKAGERAIYSGMIYTDIANGGVVIPANAMRTTFDLLQRRGVIHTRSFIGRIQQVEHGHLDVTWIAQATVDRY